MATNINQHFVIDDSGSMAPGIWGPKDPGRMAAVAACVEPVIPDCKCISQRFLLPLVILGNHVS